MNRFLCNLWTDSWNLSATIVTSTPQPLQRYLGHLDTMINRAEVLYFASRPWQNLPRPLHLEFKSGHYNARFVLLTRRLHLGFVMSRCYEALQFQLIIKQSRAEFPDEYERVDINVCNYYVFGTHCHSWFSYIHLVFLLPGELCHRAKDPWLPATSVSGQMKIRAKHDGEGQIEVDLLNWRSNLFAIGQSKAVFLYCSFFTSLLYESF